MARVEFELMVLMFGQAKTYSVLYKTSNFFVNIEESYQQCNNPNTQPQTLSKICPSFS
jgi:hypothetical protein